MSLPLGVSAPPFKNDRCTLERIEKFISSHEWTDCNLHGARFSQPTPVAIRHLDCGFERPSFEDVSRKIDVAKEVSVGFAGIGPTWSTHWFHLSLEIDPEQSWDSCALLWDAGCEAMAWTTSGRPVQGLSAAYGNTLLPLRDLGLEGRKAELWLEVAANEVMGCGKGGLIQPPDDAKHFVIAKAEVVRVEEDVVSLMRDLELLAQIACALPKESHQRSRAIFVGNAIVNLAQLDKPASLREAHALAQAFFAQGNGPNAFSLHAVGNCHIDTAWLWRCQETRRKTARSWATSLRLGERHPELSFAVSQAVQVAWLREDHPELFARVRAAVEGGRWEAVGGAWVEMDGNVPGGEAMVRQLLYGQAEFRRSFGRNCSVFWLPDTFGYSAQLPQLVAKAGMRFFLTQKLSWSLVNRFPHQSFVWRGLDGSELLTHFPPADSYGCEVKPEELKKASDNFADKGRASSALFLYGFGDGGGGPTEEMLQRLKRLRDVAELPPLKSSTPSDFFEGLEREKGNLCAWQGELYLELHNGTYTTHARVKERNRKCEVLLRDVELLDVLRGLGGGEKPKSWEEAWKKVLLNQFHDILPGTSIASVYEDAHKLYNEVEEETLAHLTREASPAPPSLLNSLSWERVVWLEGQAHRLPPLSLTPLAATACEVDDKVTLEALPDGAFRLSNKYLEAVVDAKGGVTHLWAKDEQGSKVFDLTEDGKALNTFCLYEDVPLFWDAWDVMDYHLETRREIREVLDMAKPCEGGTDVMQALEFRLRISDKSTIKQKLILRADQPYLEATTEVEWYERHGFLKAEFPCALGAQPRATYEVQFGHVERPTHRNTSWDAAKFEVCSHKWCDVSSAIYGLGLLNDGKYGASCVGGRLCLSLLRSPTAPDPSPDEGPQSFRYAVQPHIGGFAGSPNGAPSLIRSAYEFNSPARLVSGGQSLGPLLTVDNPAVLVEAVKTSESGDGVILRLYESLGGRARAALSLDASLTRAWRVDLLEEEGDELLVEEGRLEVELGPFEVLSLMCR